MHSDPAIARSLLACRAITQRHAPDLYFSTFALPASKRAATFAVFAFCRHAADRAGVAIPVESSASEVDRLVSGESDTPEFARGFSWAVNQYGIDKTLLLDHMRGERKDTDRLRIVNWPDLREHCYLVASVVGLMLARIFGLTDPRGRDHVIDLGIAMQLATFCRDVGEDLERNRIHLPADEMARAGVSEDDLRRGEVTEAFRILMREQIHRARVHFRRGEPGIALLPDDGSQFTVSLQCEMHRAILDGIERSDYDVFHRRPPASLPENLWRAVCAWWRHRCPQQ